MSWSMRQLLILVAQHPLKVGSVVLLFSVFYSFARVLVLQYVVGAVRDAILRYPKNFPHGFFLPLFHASLAVAAVAALYQDYFYGRLADFSSAQLWKHVLPLPFTLSHGKWSRLVGVPAYAFAVACVDAILTFHDPSMESVAKGLVKSFLAQPSEVDDGLSQEQGDVPDVLTQKRAELVWQVFTGGQAPSQSSNGMVSYIRLAIEVLLAAAVCASFALARFFREPQHDGDELREAARNNDILSVKLLLARGMNPDSCSGDGTTALHICGQQAIDRAAQVLLEHGANANVSDRLGFTPLHWAVQMRREEVSPTSRLATIRILLHHGADPRKPDAGGTTPLLIASRKENEASLGVLKEFIQENELTGEAEATQTETIDEVLE